MQPLDLPYAELTANERRLKLIAQTNTDTPDQHKAVGFRESVGSYELLDVQLEGEVAYTVRVRYTVPLSWCHSFDPAQPIGKDEGDANLPSHRAGL